MFGKCLENVKATCPIVHNITNYVTVNDVANAILAVGASPIMADDKAEVEEITSICSSLNINIGTLNERTIQSMLIAGKKANELCHKVLLDPVGAGASSLRTKTALKLINEVHFDVIRGNVSEIKALALMAFMTQGVDANENDAITEKTLDATIDFAKSFATKTHSVIAITGSTDIVTDGDATYVIHNGRAEMARITGTGCVLSGITSAFIAANDDTLLSTAAAVSCMGLAGEIGFENLQKGDGNATYRNRIIDALFNMTGDTLDAGAKYEVR